MRFVHISSVRNRVSIEAHGLDWARMDSARGIAGSDRPEVAGIFLCTEDYEEDYFVRMNNTGGPVDVWAVDGVDRAQLADNGNGYLYLPEPIPAAALTLLRRDVPVLPPPPPDRNGAYGSSLTITFDDR